MKKALVMTNHLHDFAGSEILALEVAETLFDMGWKVDVLGNVVSRKLIESSNPGIGFSDGTVPADASDCDFIWTQHNAVALLGKELMRIRNGSACVVSAHLSFSEPFEFTQLATGLLLNAHLVAKCGRTAEALADERNQILRAGPGVNPDWIVNFRNAAPSKFLASPSLRPKLERLLIVSNHPPEELLKAIPILRRSNVEARIHGFLHDAKKRIGPEDIEWADAIVTIAKTVQYSIMGGKPVYCYDRDGGPGWLDEGNVGKAEHFGFTGYCCRRRIAPEALAREILEGYPGACEQAVAFREKRAQGYVLEDFLNRIIEEPKPDRDLADCIQAMLASEHYNSLHVRGFYRGKIAMQNERQKLNQHIESLRNQLASSQKPPSVPPPSAGSFTLSKP